MRWIITDEERAAFKQLSNDEERDQFIEAFWQRRDPTPDTIENEYQGRALPAHCLRQRALSRRASRDGKPTAGACTSCTGRPDEIESHPSGGSYERPMEEGGGTTSTYPFEAWRYRYLEGIGQEVDHRVCRYLHVRRLSHDASTARKRTRCSTRPKRGLTLYEQMGMSNKTARFSGGGMERLGQGPFNQDLQTKQFDRLEQFAKLNKPPAVKFKDLEEVVSHKINVNLMPFDVRADFVKVTSDTVLTPITIQVKNRDITFVNKDGVQRGTVNIFGRVTTLTRAHRADL